jgi:enoyl-CoA hydratase/carnithine racemase
MKMPFEDILYEKKGNVAVATFNRPDALNAVRQATINEFLEILDDLRADDTLRVLILTGTGRAFSAGIDLAEMAGFFTDKIPLKPARDSLQRMQDITRQMVNHPKTIISAVNGIAVGMGAELAISSDIRIASENATFSFAEVKRGLFETNGVIYFLPRLVGLGRAVEMMMTGEKIPAPEALAAGLVTHVLPSDQLLDFTLGLAQKIASNAPIAVRLVKQTTRRTFDLDLEAVMQLEVDGMMECLGSEDLMEGILAFMQKRPPKYIGR